MKNSVPGTIALNIAESKVVKLHSVSICDGEGKPQNSNVAKPKKYVNARPKSRLVTIDPPDLGPRWSINAALIVSGDCTNLTVESKKIGLRDTQIMRLETDGMIEANLAQATPRLLLTNQAMYRWWHSIRKRYPWLKSALSEVRAFLRAEAADRRLGMPAESAQSRANGGY